MTVTEKLADLEKLYKEGGLREGIMKLLTKLSNNTLIISNTDPYIVDFYYLNIDCNQFDKDMNDLEVRGTLEFFDVKKSSNRTESKDPFTVNVRAIFFKDPSTNLQKIIDIIEELIVKKDSINENSISPRSVSTINEFIDGLYHNLKVLILFLDKNDDLGEFDISNLGDGEVIEYDGDDEYEEYEFVEEDDYENYEDSLDDEDEPEKEDDGDYTLEADNEGKKEKKAAGQKQQKGEDEEPDSEVKDAIRFRDRVKSVYNMGFKLKLMMSKFNVKTTAFFNKFNVGREMFYKKFFGKIDHLYEHYAGEAVIKENKLIGDPVQIYINKALPYLANLIDSVIRIYQDYMAFNDKLTTLKTYNQLAVAINNYIIYPEAKLEISEKTKPAQLIDSLKKDYRFRVATALLKDHKIYGYTVESMVVKKFPPMNHTMVCLFMEKPHEAVEEQSVNEIFETADSFKMMATKFRASLKGMIDMVNTKLQSVSLSSSMTKSSVTYNNFKTSAKMQIQKMQVQAKANPNNKEGFEKVKEVSLDMKMMAKVLKDWGALVESFAPSFLYLADAGGTLFEIMLRIDQTCRLALEAMASVETKHVDGKYKDGTYRFKQEMTPEEKAEAEEQKRMRDPNRFKKPISSDHELGTMTVK